MRPSTPDASHAAFLRLYAEREGALQTFVRSLLGSREEASEVMQEVLVVLWQKTAHYLDDVQIRLITQEVPQ